MRLKIWGILIAASLIVFLIIYLDQTKKAPPAEDPESDADANAKPGITFVKTKDGRKAVQRKELKKRPKKMELTDEEVADRIEKIMLENEFCYNDVLNEMGKAIYSETDENCDGSIEDCSYTKYDKKGNAVSGKDDYGCDGEIDSCWKSENDEFGETLKFTHDKNCDSKPEIELCFEHKYDAQGNNVSTKSWFPCGSNKVDCSRNFFDDTGNEIHTKTDEKCDGEYDYCYYAAFNENGKRLVHMTDRSCNGTIDWCKFNSYDEYDNSESEFVKGDCTARAKAEGHVFPYLKK